MAGHGEDSTSVRVAVRVRPQTSKERTCREHDVVICHTGTRQAVVGDRSFTFDYLYDQESTQEDIYSNSVRPLVEAALSGYNATVFAYGQTGSGKTYTMGSASWNDLEDSEMGVLPRALKHIFDERLQRQSQSSGPSMVLRASFIEIHNEELRDLLAPGRSGNGGTVAQGGPLTGRGRALHIREDANGGIYFAGAEEGEVASFEDVRSLLEQGTARRAVGSTEMNTHSSRSHAIFTLIIEQHVLREAEVGVCEAGSGELAAAAEEEYITSKFHFVDLAGSERLKKTKAEGERLKEGININSGLLALGNVISALGDENRMRAAQHVPYRDSKLTRMLQDSLGGNSRTLMIACVSPVESNSEESKSTLQYANRARNIKNNPVINRDPNSHLIAQLRKEVAGLRSLLHDNGIYTTLSAGSEKALTDVRNGSSAEPAAQGREASLRACVGRLEAELSEQAKLMDDFKRGMADIYTSASALEREMSALKANRDNGKALDDSLAIMHSLVTSIQEVEERCRTKMVVHAAWMPSAATGRPCDVGAPGAGAAWALAGGGSFSLNDASRNDGPAILNRSGLDLTSPRDFGGGGVGAVLDDEAMLHALRPCSSASGLVPPLALEGLNQMDGDDSMATDRTDNTARQLVMRDMDAVLIEKERLLHELVRNQRDFDTMRNAYERKMEDLQLSIRAIEEERDQTVKELESLDQRPAPTTRTSEDKERQRLRLRQLEDELKKLRKKVKDHERLLSFKQQGDEKIAKLSQEVEALKNARSQLHKKMAREAKGFREHKMELEKQIVSLRKADQSSRKLIRELETRLSSKDRSEHVQRRRAQIAMEKKKLSVEKDREGDLPKGALPKNVDVVDWFRSQVVQASRKESAQHQLESSNSLKAELDKSLHACNSKMAAMQRSPSAASMQRELQDLGDEAEYLMAELEFRSMEADKAKKHLADANKAAAEVPERLLHLPDLEVRRLVGACYEECVQQRVAMQKSSDKLHKSEVALLEAKRALQDARVKAQAAREAHESDKTRVEQEYEEKLAFIIQQLQEQQADAEGARRAASSSSSPKALVQNLARAHTVSGICDAAAALDDSGEGGESGSRARSVDEEGQVGKGAGMNGRIAAGQADAGGSSASEPSSPARLPTSLVPPVSPTQGEAGSANRRNTLSVGKALKQQPPQHEVSPLLRADTAGLQGIIDSIARPHTAAAPSPDARPTDPAQRGGTGGMRSGVPPLAIPAMAEEGATSSAQRPGGGSGSASARELAGRDGGRQHLVEAAGSRTARAQASHGSQANNVSSVQAMVIEKADKILAEKSRYAGQASGAGAGARGTPSRRKSEPLLDSTLGEGGGVGVVKLDLDKLRSGAGVGGDKSGDVHAWRDGSLRAGSGGDRDAGSRQSELSYVMDVLGTGGKKGERKHSDVRGGSGFANKTDRRARVEDLKERLQLVWEALGVAEEQRARFRNMVSGLSSKPEAALQAYEQEYALQMRQVSAAVEAARKGIEAAWQEMDMGRHDAEREEFERKFTSLLAPNHELDALNLARSELVLVEHRAEATRSIQKSLSKRMEILRRLTEAAKDTGGGSSSAATPHHDSLRKMVRDYPKIVERLKGQLAKWQASEKKIWMLGQVPALEVLDKGDEDVVYRAMHTKLMHGIQKSDKTSKAEKLSSGAVAGGASGATSALARGASAGEAEGVCTKGTSGVAAAAACGAEAESEVGVPSSGADVEQGGEQDRGGARRVGSASGAEGMRGLGREGGQLRKSTTSAMAIRFEALKQTYAQVRSRTSCLNRADGSGRQEMMRRALEDRGLLSLAREAASPPSAHQAHAQRSSSGGAGDGDAKANVATPPHRVIEAWGSESPQSPEGWGAEGPSSYVDSQRFKT